MKINPTTLAHTIQYMQNKGIVESNDLRFSVMLAMEYSGYVAQAMKEKKQSIKSNKRIDIRI